MSKSMYCPSCGTTVPIEHSLEGEYLLSSCALCGLGLAVTRASRAVKQQYGAIAHSSTGPLPNLGSGPLSIPGTGSLPNVSTGSLPSVGTGSLPSVGTGSLPSVGTGSLPKVGTGSLPRMPSVPQPHGVAAPQAPTAVLDPPGMRPASGPIRGATATGGHARVPASVLPDAALPAAAPALRSPAPPAPTPAMADGNTGESGLTGAMPIIRGPVKQMRRVYVVEDSEFLRAVTRGLLDERQLAREVVDAADGQVFLEAYVRDLSAGQKPDLIVLDVKMPGMDGREAAHAVRAIETALGAKATPILFFSALLCDADFKQTLVDLGNARYIRKGDGGDPAVLGERIVSVLERLVGARAA